VIQLLFVYLQDKNRQSSYSTTMAQIFATIITWHNYDYSHRFSSNHIGKTTRSLHII